MAAGLLPIQPQSLARSSSRLALPSLSPPGPPDVVSAPRSCLVPSAGPLFSLCSPAGHSYPRQGRLSLLIFHFKGHVLREALPSSSVPKSHPRTLSHVCSKVAPPPPWLSPPYPSPHLARGSPHLPSPGCGVVSNSGPWRLSLDGTTGEARHHLQSMAFSSS